MSQAQVGGTSRLEMLLEVGRYADALALASRLLASAPDDADLWQAVARANVGLEHWHVALDALGRCVQLTPDDPDVHLLASAALLGAGRASEAVAAAEEGARLAPNYWYAHARLAEVATQARGRTDLAWAAANRAVELAPNLSASHGCMGMVALFAKRFDVAEQALLRALELDPTNHVAQHNLGAVRVRKGQMVEATKDFAVSAQADPSAPELSRAFQAVILRWLQRTHWGLGGMYMIAVWVIPVTGQRGGSMMLAVFGVILLAWWTRRTVVAVGGHMRRVLWRVLRQSPMTAAWFGCVVVGAGTLLAGCLVPDQALRSALLQATIILLVVGVVLSWLRVGVEDRRRPGR